MKGKTQPPQSHPLPVRPGPKQKGDAHLHLGRDYAAQFLVQAALLTLYNLMLFWEMQTIPPVPTEALQAAPSLPALADSLAPSTALPPDSSKLGPRSHLMQEAFEGL